MKHLIIQGRAKLSFPVYQNISASLHVDTTVMSSSRSTAEAFFPEVEMVEDMCLRIQQGLWYRSWLEALWLDLRGSVMHFFNCLLKTTSSAGSQSSQMSLCPPPQPSRFNKDFRRSPKCAHNAFIKDAETEPAAIGKRLPTVCIYK